MAARQHAVFGILSSTFYLVLIGGIVAYRFRLHMGWGEAVFFLVCGCLIAYGMIDNVRDLAFLRFSISNDLKDSIPAIETFVPESDSGRRLSRFSDIPRPRQTRFTKTARSMFIMHLILGVIFLGGVSVMLFREKSLPVWLQSAWLLLLAFMVGYVAARFHKDRDLTKNGEFTKGMVLKQSFNRLKTDSSKVYYKFEAGNGDSYDGEFDDETKTLFPGMEVEIFYDAAKPRRHIVLQDSTYEPSDPMSSSETRN